jgi:hypothetical protein
MAAAHPIATTFRDLKASPATMTAATGQSTVMAAR